MKKILVLGGYGLTGGHLSRLLLEHTNAEIAGRNPQKAETMAAALNRSFGPRAYAARVDTLKIDRHFVARMNDEPSQNIVRTIISLAHNLRMNVVAEGAETAEQVAPLNGMKCDCIQGFFFSRPVEAERFESLLEKQYPARNCAR